MRFNKFHAIRTSYNGRSYASKAEARRAMELDFMVKGGEIDRWEPQVRIALGIPENVYVPDFEIFGIGSKHWYEDVKGMETAAFKKNKRLWRVYGPGQLRILKAKGKSGWEIETVDGKPRIEIQVEPL